MAESTEMAGVITASPHNSDAPHRPSSMVTATALAPSFLAGNNSSRANMPPSPLLSARRMKDTYLIVMTTVSDQKISDRTPMTLAVVSSMACRPWKHSFTA